MWWICFVFIAEKWISAYLGISRGISGIRFQFHEWHSADFIAWNFQPTNPSLRKPLFLFALSPEAATGVWGGYEWPVFRFRMNTPPPCVAQRSMFAEQSNPRAGCTCQWWIVISVLQFNNANVHMTINCMLRPPSAVELSCPALSRLKRKKSPWERNSDRTFWTVGWWPCSMDITSLHQTQSLDQNCNSARWSRQIELFLWQVLQTMLCTPWNSPKKMNLGKRLRRVTPNLLTLWISGYAAPYSLTTHAPFCLLTLSSK